MFKLVSYPERTKKKILETSLRTAFAGTAEPGDLSFNIELSDKASGVGRHKYREVGYLEPQQL